MLLANKLPERFFSANKKNEKKKEKSKSTIKKWKEHLSKNYMKTKLEIKSNNKEKWK